MRTLRIVRSRPASTDNPCSLGCPAHSLNVYKPAPCKACDSWIRRIAGLSDPKLLAYAESFGLRLSRIEARKSFVSPSRRRRA